MASASSAGKPAPEERHQIIMFGGHGSPTIFSTIAAQRAQDDADQSVAGAIFLSRCHTAFLEELLGLEDWSRQKLGLGLTKLQNQKNFLVPPESLHNNPIVQATTLYVYQLLRYIAELERPNSRLDTSGKRILETVGVCSGLLPAAVVATSTTTSEFIDNGIAAFRLAFRIASKSAVYGHSYEEGRENSGSCLLVIKGLSQTQVEEKLKSFWVQTKRRMIRLSAILSASMVSVTGPNEDLRSFHEWLGSKVTVKYTAVNAWYHGGDQLKFIADKVMHDIEKREIQFPSSCALHRPLRSSRDGTFANGEELGENGLARWVVWHMLIYPFDWLKTSEAIVSTLTPIIASQDGFRPQFLSFGPSSEWLLGGFKNQDGFPKFDIMEMSAFQASKTANPRIDHKDDIAIVGMGLHYPKGHGPEQLWDTLCNGVVAVSDIPKSRFDASIYHNHDSPNKSRTMATHHGAFIDDLWKFDNTFFNITPREAKSMDPQQRILLHTAQAALDDAGYVRDSTPTFQRATMGCYIGLATGDYTDNLRDEIDVFYSPGTLRAFHGGRISFVHNLSGPSIVTDTACSSSLVAVYQACRALNNGDCTAAIAGGVNTISSPDMYLGLSSGHFLSPTGGCRPFDASADGYCRAEGCGVFILKRYSDAIRENDQIYGVIKGVEVNQSGNAHSITHPHSETQTQLFQRLLSKTGVEPSTISVVEAHGTGTQAGDAREIASLQSTFSSSHSMQHPLIVSSIKGNIGHAEAASGVAGLAKVLLMLRKNIVPRQAGFSQLNPRLAGLEDAGIIIPITNREWLPQTRPRRAMLNNFGAAGSNVALLLEENIETDTQRTGGLDRSSYVFNVSAQNAATHQAYIREYQLYLRDVNTKPHIKDICYTAAARRETYSHRFSISCSSIEDLKAKLKNVDVSDREPSRASKAVVFAFSGQGSIYRGMSEGLMHSSTFFRDEVRLCDKIVQDLGFPSFLSYFTGDYKGQESLSVSEEIITSQCACLALEYSVAKLLMSWNIVPTYVVGHSLGEYAALAIAGAINLEDTLRIVASRAQMMADECPAGESGMIACKTSPLTVDQILAFEKVTPQLAIACRNSSNDCVVSGPLGQLDHFEQICNIKPIKAKRLDVPYGYHSASMEPIVKPLEDLGRSVTWSSPSIPIASSLHGRLLQAIDCQSDYFAKHSRQPVRFAEAIESISAEEGFRDSICVEIGPQPTVSTLVKTILTSDSCPCFPALKKGVDAWSTLNTVLSQLFLVNYDLRWREIFADCQPVTTNLPVYPLGGTDFQVAFTEPICKSGDSAAPSYSETGFPLLPKVNLTKSSSDSIVCETTSAILGPLISGHNVGGTAICPASVYHELVIEAAQSASLSSEGHVWVVSNMSFTSPLIHDPSGPIQKIILHLHKIEDGNSFEVEITSDGAENSQTITYFASTVSRLSPTMTMPHRVREAALIKRQSFYFTKIGQHNTIRTKVLYEKMFTRVVSYSKEYFTLQELNISSSNLEGYGTFKLPSDLPTKGYIVPPAFSDTLLHTAGFIANLIVESDEICICSHVDSVEVLYESLDFGETFTIHCNLFDEVQGSIVADAFVSDSRGQTIALCCGMVFKKLRLKTLQTALQPTLKAETLAVEPMEAFPSSETTMTPSATGARTPESAGEERQVIRTKIQNIMSHLCGFRMQDLSPASSLPALGVDSLLQIEIASALKQAFPTSTIDQDTVAACDTVRSLEDTLISQTNPRDSSTKCDVILPAGRRRSSDNSFLSQSFPMESSPNRASILQISKDELSAPLFCFHDGSGQGSLYGRIGHMDRTLYAFSDPDYATNNLRPVTLSQMASRYAATISKSDTPSLILCGWSFGGVVALEAAHTLQASGFDVKGLILIDSPYPQDHQPLPDKIIRHMLSKINSKDSIDHDGSDDSTKSHLLTEFKANAALLSAYSPPVMHSYIKTVILHSRDTIDTEALCGVRYEWLSSPRTRAEAIKGWEKIIGSGVDVLEIPGNHFEAFDEGNIAELSAQMKRACQIIESST